MKITAGSMPTIILNKFNSLINTVG